MFFMPDHSFQVILEVELDNNSNITYIKTRKENPDKPLIIMNNKSMLLRELVNSGSFDAKICFANEDGDQEGSPIIKSTTVTVKKKLLFESLNPNTEYPEILTYYLYGSGQEFHLSHVLSRAPNFQQELDVTLSGDIIDKINELDSEILKISFPSLKERTNQPITIDPLTGPEFTIGMDNRPEMSGKIKIINKFWINNNPLNSEPHHHHNMNM
jgi:hypothetical protein